MNGNSENMKYNSQPVSNIDRTFNGFHKHHQHYNPYESHMDLGTMFIPSYTMYGLNPGYDIKLSGNSEEQGYTSYENYFPEANVADVQPEFTFIPKFNKKNKHASALSALTLLAFLFFLNLLQNCLKENILTMNPTVMVMTAGLNKEGYQHFDILDEERTMVKEEEDVEHLFRYNNTKNIKNGKNNTVTHQSVSTKLQSVFSDG